MSTATTVTPLQREPELLGQTVVVIGGSAGIGLETARRARADGADVILTGRNPDRLERAAREVGAVSTAAFDATDHARLERFFDELPKPIDQVMASGGGPYYAPLAEMDFAESGSTSSRPASSTRRCRPRCSARGLTRGARSSAPRCRSGAWSGRRTLPRSPCTS